MFFALSGLGPSRVPRPLSVAAQGTLAVTIGVLIEPDTMGVLADNWIAVVGVGLATLAISAGGGALLSLHRDVDAVTGMLSLAAGGATGLVAVAKELGGDERIVVVVQYLRVALVVVTMPLIATLAFQAQPSHVPQADAETSLTHWWWGIVFVIACIGIGLPLARLIRLPIPATLGPLIVAGTSELLNFPPDMSVPSVVLPAALMIIGWQAGLAFTVSSLRIVGRVLPYAAFLVVSIGGVCALLGWLLSIVTHTSLLTGYLATTPGGLAAVLAVSASTGANVVFVACVQLLRLLLMLAFAPVASRVLLRRVDKAQRQAVPSERVSPSEPNGS